MSAGYGLAPLAGYPQWATSLLLAGALGGVNVVAVSHRRKLRHQLHDRSRLKKNSEVTLAGSHVGLRTGLGFQVFPWLAGHLNLTCSYIVAPSFSAQCPPMCDPNHCPRRKERNNMCERRHATTKAPTRRTDASAPAGLLVNMSLGSQARAEPTSTQPDTGRAP